MSAALVGILVVLGALATAIAHEFTLGARAIATSDDALHRGDLALAISAAREAAEAKAPTSPYPELGYSRLATIAESARARGDEPTARAAWRAERAAALATRTLDWAPLRLQEASDGLSRLDSDGGSAVRTTTLVRDDAPSGWLFCA